MSVSIKNVTKMYGDARALDNVSVEIADGEFIAILGPSGCGKTTLLRTISGFVRPTGGTVEVDGRLFSSDKVQVPVEQRGLGMVFQSFALWPHMTVRQNIEFPLKSRRNQALPPSSAARRWKPPWPAPDWKNCRTGCPANFPAASASGWPWPGPLWKNPPCC